MRCYEGNILTVNAQNAVYRYLIEDKGRILYVGNALPEEYKNVKRLRLGKRALVPAFVDTHQHFASYSTFHAGLNVMEAKSNQEIAEVIQSFAAASSQKTLIAFGISHHSVQEKQLITRRELDGACSDKEIMVVKYDGHACVINTKLLQKLRKKICRLRGYHPDTGEMNQEAFFAVSNYITNSISIPELIKNMQTAVDDLAAKGIGCVHTVSGVGFIANLDITMEQLFAKGLNNGFQIRVFPQSLNVKAAIRRKIPRIGGCFECALDGCFGSHDASLHSPYIDDEKDYGVLYYEDERIQDFCKKANRAGLQIELHAIGDRAFDQACRCIKAALDDYPRTDHRHGIIHDCLPTEEGISICKKYDIQMPVQSAFIDWPQEPENYLKSILGKERTEKLNPIRTFLQNDILVSFGSDAPCTEPDPIMWMDKAVNNPNTKEEITIEEALRCCTYNGYKACFDEKDRGSLEIGKIADMVILSENPYEIEKEKIGEIKVERTILKGRPYRSCKENILRQMIKGISL